MEKCLEKPYKELYDLETRKRESGRIRKKYPERYPIIVEKSNYCKKKITLTKKKYLAPVDLTIGEFIYVVRKRMILKPEEAIYLFINDSNLISPSKSLSDIYEKYVNEDGFLYINYSTENTFG